MRFSRFFPSLTVAAVFLALCAPYSPVAAASEGGKPLMVIRFNQEHVYFSRALRQAVVNAESAVPGVRYHVVSYQPSGKRKGQAPFSTEQAKKNLASVATMISELGVDAARIQTDSKSSSVPSQEIHIFIE